MMVSAVLQRSLGQGIRGIPGQYAATRVPMTFTSRLRTSLSPIVQRHLSNFYGTSGGANSWLMKYVTMAVNPNTIGFKQTKRLTKRDTQEGSTFFHFTNSKGQNNDILVVRFSGSTGNIDLRGSAPNADGTTAAGLDTGALYKLQVWQNLYMLGQEPMLLADNADNVFSISYSSALFQVPITLEGFFSTNVDFTETADKPNSRQYEFEFTVNSVNPPINELIQTMGAAFLPQTAEVAPDPLTSDQGVSFA